MEVMLAEVMALKAYSGEWMGCQRWLMMTKCRRTGGGHAAGGSGGWVKEHTDLIQTTLVGEDSDVSVVACE